MVKETKNKYIKKEKGAIAVSQKAQLAEAVSDDQERETLVRKVLTNSRKNFRISVAATNEEIEERVEEYFDNCFRNGRLPTVEGLALSLGVSVRTMEAWERGEVQARRGPLVARAKQVIAEVDAQLVAMGKMPAVPYIFRAKNYYGMSDKTEVQVSAPDYTTLSEEELKNSIKATVIDVEVD